jgi:hypothetical protein
MTPTILTAEGAALDHDPASLAQMRARKAILQAQEAELATAGAAD